ncbi:Hypothetical protein SRAE_0000073000 [Strongyloides ratti]|uniref:Uncharacterized protein n=1 Tax=Strongyloides ratti TaxID=34506 RepID=A0A090MTG7_STRRB|nr:Hypothetical protein SRAE_0000073000 [Strongyloides ratti]CEF61613.1 Hypothetical protein SRAE_0000073000 [Strongyloides ratti]
MIPENLHKNKKNIYFNYKYVNSSEFDRNLIDTCGLNNNEILNTQAIEKLLKLAFDVDKFKSFCQYYSVLRIQSGEDLFLCMPTGSVDNTKTGVLFVTGPIYTLYMGYAHITSPV